MPGESSDGALEGPDGNSRSAAIAGVEASGRPGIVKKGVSVISEASAGPARKIERRERSCPLSCPEAPAVPFATLTIAFRP
jgi:hypothetical protein